MLKVYFCFGRFGIRGMFKKENEKRDFEGSLEDFFCFVFFGFGVGVGEEG